MARRKMLPKKISMWGLFLMVDWAEPLPEVENSVLEKVFAFAWLCMTSF